MLNITDAEGIIGQAAVAYKASEVEKERQHVAALEATWSKEQERRHVAIAEFCAALRQIGIDGEPQDEVVLVKDFVLYVALSDETPGRELRAIDTNGEVWQISQPINTIEDLGQFLEGGEVSDVGYAFPWDADRKPLPGDAESTAVRWIVDAQARIDHANDPFAE